MEKKYRRLTRREADALAEAEAPVEWRYNIDRYSVRGRMHEWKPWYKCYGEVDGYDDQFRVEVE